MRVDSYMFKKNDCLYAICFFLNFLLSDLKRFSEVEMFDKAVLG